VSKLCQCRFILGCLRKTKIDFFQTDIILTQFPVKVETMTTKTIRIGGMTCLNCQTRIENKLKSAVGVEEATANYNTGTVTVTWNASVITFSEIKSAIESLDYKALGDTGRSPVLEIIGTLAIILSLYTLAQALGISALASSFPLVETGMGYGMLFIIGIITSVHCVAMCGGINLSQCLPAAAVPQEGRRWKVLFPAILYNAGRVISYTIVGVIVGTLGSVVSAPGRFQGAVQLIAGVFMIITGLNMLGIFQGSLGTLLRRFNLRLPKIFTKKIDKQKAKHKNPLIIGLLNGLMPCGPLQAMQLYALSTGNPIAGGVSMFLFSMGTVPLMFGVGAVSSLLSKKFTRRAVKTGAMLVTVMGMTMFAYGWGLAGFNLSFINKPSAAGNPSLRFGSTPSGDGAFAPPIIEEGVQIVSSTLRPGRYPAITVQQGVPVKWIITAPQGSINGCNNRMIIREYKI
jgi:sulfite exporter TauE/SafE/copper chaperone CopZ